MRWRVLVHALDRTGPPVLARSLITWLRASHPDDEVDVVSMRSGDQLEEFLALCPTRVLLAPFEGWDHTAPPPMRSAQFTRMLADLPEVDVTLLVSVSGCQVLPFVPTASSPVVAWTVEQGPDLHWLDSAPGLVEGITHWLPGSHGTAAELRERLGPAPLLPLAPEFILPPTPVDPTTVENHRSALGISQTGTMVVGAGIATNRKAPDLFFEVAVAAHRQGLEDLSFVWIGGESDSMFSQIVAEVGRLALPNMQMHGSVADLNPWFAAADVLLHPARLDAFPLVCLHAAAAGTPVVAFAESVGVAEMFGADFLGASFPDVAALAGVVGRLRDVDVRRAAGLSQQLRVNDRFVADVAAPVLYDEVQVLLSAGPMS